MSTGSWLDKPKYTNVKTQDLVDIPKGFWDKCKNCGDQITFGEYQKNLFVCGKCGFHGLMPYKDRIDLLTDSKSFKEKFTSIKSCNPLGYSDGVNTYDEKLAKAKATTGTNEAVIVGEAKINKTPIVLGVMIFRFIGGSMGSVVGEKIYQAMELAMKNNVPFVLVCASGGARMQEGLLSLVQMAKTSMGVQKMKQKGIPFITILTHPTMGGVTASFASTADIIIAEPQAEIGFAGRRVIESFIKQDLPKDFQTSEYLFEKGFIDCVVHRNELKGTLTRILGHLDHLTKK